MPSNKSKTTKNLHDKDGEADNSATSDTAEQLINFERELVLRLSQFTSSGKLKLKKSSNVEYIYNPLEYAAELHNQFNRKYCNSTKKVLFLGMNPGPWGMCQTGVPFGEVNAVRDYLKITGEVEEPKSFHPNRKVEGLNCKRSEVSGKRLWELINKLSKGDPFVFFKDCFVYNYCPLALIGKTGLNITPADLKSGDAFTLNAICDEFLLKVIKLLNVKTIVALGRFVEKRTNEIIKKYDVKDLRVCVIQHPSPRNKGSNLWQEDTIKRLTDYGLIQYLQ